ncbi:MAG TPA: 4-hydroxy-3-methylbut-2-enyl diphosphate reductase [Desulfobacterales bacterium]|nr:4-hydroxy-3-methylbut-2-enyl diphosphate reductase [Desulfobacterales bacterium]
MKVYIAKKAGFCMGVRRAVDLTINLVNREGGNISTYGPLIHNPQVLAVLEDKGVGVLREVPAASSAPGTVIIRAHGVPPAEKEALQDAGLQVKDATCPRVLKVQAIISRHRKLGMTTVIIGDRNHAEVEGLMGYAGPDCRVVSNEADAEALSLEGEYIIVSQTTQDELSFNQLCRIIQDHHPGGRVFSTICDSTHKRQHEVRKLCQTVDALVVVGGRASANTKRLAEIATGMGKEVFLIETESEIDPDMLNSFKRVGVTAGASTPTWMINRVVRTLEAIPCHGDNPLRALSFRVMRWLMASNLYVAAGGGIMTGACCLLQGIQPTWQLMVIAFGYLFAMHNLNRITDQRAKIFNDPILMNFYINNRNIFFLSSVTALIAALAIGWLEGSGPFILLLIMSIFGTLYSVKFIPPSISGLLKVKMLKEIPGSKTIFVALAWAMVLTILPAMSQGGITPLTVSTFIFILLLVLVRNAVFDLFDLQGDRIVGKETMPVLLGFHKTMVLLKIIMAILFVMPLILTPMGLMIRPYGYLLLPGLVYLFLFLVFYEKGYYTPGVRLEFALETAFIIIGFSIWLGTLLPDILI